MNKKRLYFGVYIFWAVALLVLPLWWLSYPESTIKHNFSSFHVYGSQVFALMGFSFFAMSFVLATRLNFLEDLFGGLDKVYHAHHNMAKVAFLGILMHPLLLAMRWVPDDISKAIWYLFPVHRRFEINVGSVALWGVFLLLIMTFVVKLPYHWWKKSHKMLGLFFIASVVHIYLTDSDMYGNRALKFYFGFLSLIGISAWIYKTLLFKYVKKRLKYKVLQINHLSNKVMEIELSPMNEKLRFVPGQFCFFSFHCKEISREAHPYTITKVKDNGNLLIMVKSLGAYTQRLNEKLTKGSIGIVEGPYGRFDYTTGSNHQVWIGGGVGIAPFISWANDLISKPRKDLKLDIFYCVNHESEATHAFIFHTLEKVMPSAQLHLICRDVQGLIKMGAIEDVQYKDIFICGPKEMRKSLLYQGEKLNLKSENIYFEDFDFV